MVCDVVAIPRNVALSTFGLPRIGLCCQPAQGEFNEVRGMSLKLRERVIEMLASRPDERFKAREIASWIYKNYRAEADEKLAASKWATRSEEHTSEHQSLLRRSSAVFCLQKKNTRQAKNMK